jgi:hypothetical protein
VDGGPLETASTGGIMNYSNKVTMSKREQSQQIKKALYGPRSPIYGQNETWWVMKNLN